jgi:nitrite reductase/ring-hydroxylating ferredoxin subunit
MAQDESAPAGPDLTQGIMVAELQDGGMLVGHVGGDEVLLVRQGTDVFAVGAHCTHYHGPLVDGIVADGIVFDGKVRCPWLHAWFSLRTGEAVHAPAFDDLA